MRKKLTALLCAVVVFCCFYGCELPSKVEIKGNPEVSLKVDPETGDISGRLRDAVLDSLPDDENITVLDYTSFTGRKAQTFIIQYDVLKDFELEFMDKLNDVDGILEFGDIGESDLSHTIPLDAFSDMGTLDPVDFIVNMSGVLGNLKTTLDGEFAKQSASALPIIVGTGVAVPFDVPFDLFELNGFDDITFAAGKIQVKFQIANGTTDIPPVSAGNVMGANITFSSISLRLLDDTVIAAGKTEGGSSSINLNSAASSQIVEFDLAGKKLPNKFKVSLGDYVDNTSYGGVRAIDITIAPQGISGSKIRGFSGFDLDDVDVTVSDQQDDIDLGLGGQDFLHAEISVGTFAFNMNIPTDKSAGLTWIEGIDVAAVVDLFQDKITVDSGTYIGLSDQSNPLAPWTYTYSSTPASLNGIHMNYNPIEIVNSDITVNQTVGKKVSFMLSNEDLDAGTMTISLTPVLKIEEFATIDFILDAFAADLPDNEISLADVKDYLKSIHFDELGFEIEFGQVDINNLKIEINVVGLYDENNNACSPIKSGEITANDTLKVVYENVNLVMANLDPINPNLTLSFNLLHNDMLISDADKMTLTNFELKDEIKFEILSVTPVLEWTEALVNLEGMDVKGSFPEEGGKPIDLSAFSDYLKGFTFDGIQANVYINGPSIFFDILDLDDIKMTASYSGGPAGGKDLLVRTGTFASAPKPNINKDGTGKYSGPLPTGGIKLLLEDVLNAMPDDLIINYDAGGEFTINKTSLDAYNGTDNKLNVSIIMVLPLSLRAQAGAKINFNDMFSDGDILGRDGSDSSMSEFIGYINELFLEVEFSDNILSGGTLYIINDVAENDKNYEWKFSMSSKKMTIPIKGSMFDYVNNTVPYIPKEIGVRFNNAVDINIPDDLKILNLKFRADFTVKLDL